MTDYLKTLASKLGLYDNRGGAERAVGYLFNSGMTYRIKIRTVGWGRDKSDWYEFTYVAPLPSPQIAPANFNADLKFRGIELTWDRISSLGMKCYRVYRAVDSAVQPTGKGRWSSTSGSGMREIHGTSLVDHLIDESHTYYYWVCAVDYCEQEGGFATDNVSTSAIDAPTISSVTYEVWRFFAHVGFSDVTVTFGKITDAESYLLAYKKSGSGNWQYMPIAQETTSTISFTLHNLRVDSDTGTTYNFKIRACRAITWNSAWSSQYDLMIYPDTTVPDAPTNVSATMSNAFHHIVVSWTSPAAKDIKRYRIYRYNATEVSWTEAGQSFTEWFRDFDVDVGSNYQYAVRAEDWDNNISAASTLSSVITVGKPGTPVITSPALTRTVVGDQYKTVLSFVLTRATGDTQNPSWYLIRYYVTGTSAYQYKPIDCLSSPQTITIEVEDHTHNYLVAAKAYNWSRYYSGWSADSTATYTATTPSVPVWFDTGCYMADEQVQLTWNLNAESEAIKDYYLFKREDTTTPVSSDILTSIAHPTNKFVDVDIADDDIEASKTYSYSLKAVNKEGIWGAASTRKDIPLSLSVPAISTLAWEDCSGYPYVSIAGGITFSDISGTSFYEARVKRNDQIGWRHLSTSENVGYVYADGFRQGKAYNWQVRSINNRRQRSAWSTSVSGTAPEY